ncbi:MAG: DUF3108 domain-containing protein [Hyphomicrobiaceae bacterium]|nr:DUF3108 domain-containing protein [Hyphomicrobiaceae bacterium]
MSGLLALAGIAFVPPSPDKAAAAPKHSRLAAVYDIRFSGVRLGEFEVWSNVNEESYSLRGKGELKFITRWFFEIKGGTTTAGTVTENGPKPATFAFNFKTKKRRGELAMMFENDSVSYVKANPPFSNSSKTIPVTAAHVKGVLDPLSAIFFTAKATNLNEDGSVCPGRVPVFDGKQRFDLVLSHKKTIQVKKKRRKKGYRGPAVVCRIKYEPIAGYKPDNAGVKFMAATDDIEVWLIEVPKNGMYVPYHVIIPTPYGTASATSTAFHVEIPGFEKFAVVR